jgi:hypothetical protein
MQSLQSNPNDNSLSFFKKAISSGHNETTDSAEIYGVKAAECA